jgi:serine/threonine-protein kinase
MSSDGEREKRIGNWILEERAGSGGLSDVWRAVNTQDGKIAALKILREPERSPTHTTRFLREGLLLARLNHPGLPRCISASEEPRPHIALELLEGQTLSEHLRTHGPLDATRAATVLESLLKVLHYLHQHGIVHRDVKPSNVYLASDRRVLMLDLGLAVDPEDPLTTTLGDVMGTYAYMAPEQIAGAEVDHRCDLYSLGVTLYESLSGTRPFRADDAGGYLEAHRRGIKTPLTEMVPQAPIRLLDTISRLMARDPMVRPESASIARAMLTGSSGHTRTLRPPSLLGRMAAQGAVEAVLDDSGTVVLVGEIGSGMGRMAAETLRMAREQHFEIIAIRCSGRAPPMDPIDQLLRDLRRVLGKVSGQIEAIGRAIEGLAGEGPLLILIEEIEHCSDAAERVLRKVLALAPRVSVVMTGSRPPQHISAHQVALRPLNINEVQRLLMSMLGTPSPPARLAAQLRRMSGGQPAVIVLALNDLVARGALSCSGIGPDGMVEWKLDRNAPLQPSTGMVQLYGNIIENLPSDSLKILKILALVGEAFPLSVILAIAEADPSGLDIGPLRVSNLITVDDHLGEIWIGNRRPAISVLMLAQMSDEQQRLFHRGVVRALRSRPEGGWRDERIAWHQAHSADANQTPLALLDLAEDLLSRGQADQAKDVLNRAVSLEVSDSATAARLALTRGEVLDRLSNPEQALGALRAGRRLAEGLNEPELVGKALVLLARVHHHLGDERRSTSLAEEAIERLEISDQSPFLPFALELAANGHRLAGRPEKSNGFFRRCLHIARVQGNRECMARAMGGIGILFSEEGDLDQGLHHLQQEASWFRVHGRKENLVVCLYRIAICHRRMGRPDLALEALQEAETASRFAGLSYHRALVMVGRAGVHLALGDVGGASTLLEKARDARDSGAPTWVRMNWQEAQAHLRLRSGDIQAALAVYQAAEIEAGRAGYIVMSAFFLGMTGVITADPDSITDAMEVLGSAGDRTMGARLLLHGATVGGDSEVLESAKAEIRASGDRFLLLEVLLASAGVQHQDEALKIASEIGKHVPKELMANYLEQPMVRWTGLRSLLRTRRG